MLSAHRTVAGIEFLQIFFFSLYLSLSLSFLPSPFRSHYLPVDNAIENDRDALCFSLLFYFFLGLLSIILWTLFCSPSLSVGTLCLTTWENNFAVANADYFFFFIFFSHVGKHNHTQGALASMPSLTHLPLFANVQ
jgi:hypothetical protein